MVKCLLPLRCKFQTYLWGEKSESQFIKLFLKDRPDLLIKDPIAELWFGSHKNGEATVFSNNTWMGLSEFWEISGITKPLNFLSKILCVKKPLSIQLHPAKLEAVRLNKINPQQFPDPNPKPEMAIALTTLKVLCGIRGLAEISELLISHPAFQDPIGPRLINSISSGGIRNLLKETLSLPHEIVKEFANRVLNSAPNSPHDNIARTTILDASELDPGIIALYFLNYHEVKKGNAIYIQPNVPHAYIEGYAFESMQNSDNVVRGGLTSKHIDVTNFCDLVNIEDYDPFQSGQQLSNEIKRYKHPELPFILDAISSEKNSREKIILEQITSHEILVVLNGVGTARLNNESYKLDTGSCYYSNGRNELELVGSDLQVFRVWSEASF